jgi:predicted methyltransferase
MAHDVIPRDRRMSDEHSARPGRVVLSHVQAAELLSARRAGSPAAMSSPDLGLTRVAVALGTEGVVYPSGPALDWATVDAIDRAETKCFLVEDGSVREIRVFSEHTGWVRSLMPTRLAPTTLVSGTLMHRIKDTDPYHDTLTKIAAIAPVRGRVLDTATGLGYTAIEAARTACHVVTIELDPAALAIARLNPWSRGLFDNAVIEQIVGDAGTVVESFAGGSFDRIIHDPPTISLAGELYSEAFYRQLHRVLAPGGRVFHYIGAADSRSGSVVTRGVIRRLTAAGFRRVVRRPEAFGVVAHR